MIFRGEANLCAAHAIKNIAEPRTYVAKIVKRWKEKVVCAAGLELQLPGSDSSAFHDSFAITPSYRRLLPSHIENHSSEAINSTHWANTYYISRISSGTSARKMSGISPDVTHFFNIYYPGAVEDAGAPLTAQTALSNGNGAPSAPTEKA